MTDAGDGTLSSASLDEPGCTHGANAFTNNAGANIEGDGCLLENDKTDGGCVNDDEYIETQEEFSDRDASCSSRGESDVEDGANEITNSDTDANKVGLDASDVLANQDASTDNLKQISTTVPEGIDSTPSADGGEEVRVTADAPAVTMLTLDTSIETSCLGSSSTDVIEGEDSIVLAMSEDAALPTMEVEGKKPDVPETDEEETIAPETIDTGDSVVVDAPSSITSDGTDAAQSADSGSDESTSNDDNTDVVVATSPSNAFVDEAVATSSPSSAAAEKPDTIIESINIDTDADTVELAEATVGNDVAPSVPEVSSDGDDAVSNLCKENELSPAVPEEPSSGNNVTSPTPDEPTSDHDTTSIAPEEPSSGNDATSIAPEEPSSGNDATSIAPEEPSSGNDATLTAAEDDELEHDAATPPPERDSVVVNARIESLKEAYLKEALEDWLEDHPDEDPLTSTLWATEMENALVEFYDTLEDDDDLASPEPTGGNSMSPVSATPDVDDKSPEKETSPRATAAPPAGRDSEAASPESELRPVSVFEVPNVITGWFRKSRGGDGRKSGAQRFFELHGFMIKYFTKEPVGGKNAKERGRIQLLPITEISVEGGSTLTITNPKRTWKLQTNEPSLIALWASTINNVLQQLKAQQTPTAAPKGIVTAKQAETTSASGTNTASDGTETASGVTGGNTEAGSAPAPQKSKGATKRTKKDEFVGHVHGDIRQGEGVGGFTATMLTPTADATKAIKTAHKTHALITLKILPETMELEVDATSPCALKKDALAAQIVQNEPRYYFLVEGKHKVFVYCCPDDSPRKPRMLYSTGKKSVIELAKKLGHTLTATLEISDANDIDDDDLRPSAASLKKKRQEAKAPPPKHVRGAPKPVVLDPKKMSGSLSAYMAKELGDKNKSGVGKTKKIVIAPDAAHRS